MALVQLDSTVEFTNYIRPVCLAASGSVFPAGQDSWVTGWGTLVSDGGEDSFCDDLVRVNVFLGCYLAVVEGFECISGPRNLAAGSHMK